MLRGVALCLSNAKGTSLPSPRMSTSEVVVAKVIHETVTANFRLRDDDKETVPTAALKN